MMIKNSEKIICITNRTLCPIPLEEQLEKVVNSGITRVILREKDLSEQDYSELAKKILGIRNIDLTVHSFPNIARTLSVKKIHLPLKALTKEICKEFEVSGTSVHSVSEAVEAEKIGVSYVIAGHIFATDCKKDLPPRGLSFLEEVCRSVKIPVYAIGGINGENMKSALDAGASGVCIMSGLMKI